MYYAGIDIGSLSAETVVINQNREVLGWSIIPSGADHKTAIDTSFSTTLEKTGIHKDDVRYIVSTGYGRINVPFAHKQVTEIACHGKGAYFLFPQTKTVIDIGGQDNKVIKIGKNGKVIDFLMNDKCAAGTGRFLEVMAHALNVDIKDMGEMSLKSQKCINISSTCGIFAESEVVSLIAQGNNKSDIIRGLHNSIADRIQGMINRVGLSGEVTMTGGGAKNTGVVNGIEEKLGMKINIPNEPQIVGALGAALIAMEMSSDDQ